MTVSLHNELPPLLRDRGFWGLNLTQFLGAFNDNLFKQLVMLLCIDQAKLDGRDLQGFAMVLFAAPFIAISGYAGFLSDRFSKRTIIVLCKLAEVVIVVLGMIGFMTGSLPLLLAILCLMGVHSAFFGPSKYGILPEMIRSEDLPRANGMMMMATFLAIIFGLSAAGAAKHFFSSTLWLASLPCLVIAVSGLVSSLAIRKTPAAQPGLRFQVSSIAIPPETRTLLRGNRTLLGVLFMSSMFWFIGGIIYPSAINSLGREQFRFNDLITGMLAATTGVGIAVGCLVAGIVSKDRVRGGIVRMGAWGLTLSLLLLALPGPGWTAVREEVRAARLAARANEIVPARVTADPGENPPATEGEAGSKLPTPVAENAPPLIGEDRFYRGTLLGPWGSAAALVSVGLFAGFYSVPLLVYLQSAAPVEQKGRIIGANNLMNWIGIAVAGSIYSVGKMILVGWLMLPQATLFAFAAILMLPVAIFYRPPDAKIGS